MPNAIRIPVQTARQKIMAGQALLVCAYTDDAKFASNRLEGALSLQAFQSRLPELEKSREIIFYCA